MGPASAAASRMLIVLCPLMSHDRSKEEQASMLGLCGSVPDIPPSSSWRQSRHGEQRATLCTVTLIMHPLFRCSHRCVELHRRERHHMHYGFVLPGGTAAEQIQQAIIAD